MFTIIIFVLNIHSTVFRVHYECITFTLAKKKKQPSNQHFQNFGILTSLAAAACCCY